MPPVDGLRGNQGQPVRAAEAAHRPGLRVRVPSGAARPGDDGMDQEDGGQPRDELRHGQRVPVALSEPQAQPDTDPRRGRHHPTGRRLVRQLRVRPSDGPADPVGHAGMDVPRQGGHPEGSLPDDARRQGTVVVEDDAPPAPRRRPVAPSPGPSHDPPAPGRSEEAKSIALLVPEPPIAGVGRCVVVNVQRQKNEADPRRGVPRRDHLPGDRRPPVPVEKGHLPVPRRRGHHRDTEREQAPANHGGVGGKRSAIAVWRRRRENEPPACRATAETTPIPEGNGTDRDGVPKPYVRFRGGGDGGALLSSRGAND
mmetsp:Transcript_18526/g.42761  ORF Transcript_18526/g.42761 Transcript_18526/m.42761 type:complete len:312 (-) Transcript_18526:834-1769(-)